MSADIVARLTVDASTFTPQINSQYAQIAANAKSVNAEFASSFSSTVKGLEGTAKRSFYELSRELRALSTDAASRGPGKDGAFSFDVSAAKSAALASRDRAAALQQFVAAAERAVAAEGDLTGATRLYLQAGQAELVQEVARSNELTHHAAALEKLTGAMNTSVSAGGRATVSSGQMRVGMQQLGYQVSDVAQQLGQKGVSAMTVFSQQAPQVVQALSLMTSRTDGFLGALAGWPGIITVAALTLGTTLYNALNAESEALKTATEEADKHSKSLEDMAGSARNALLSVTALADAEAAKAKGDAAAALDKVTAATNRLVAAEQDLAALRADVKTWNFVDRLASGPVIRAAEERVSQARRDIGAGSRDLKALESISNAKTQSAIQTSAGFQATPEGQKQAEYARKRDAVTARYLALGELTNKQKADEQKELVALAKAERREIDAIQKSEQSRRSATSDRIKTREQAIGIAGRELQSQGFSVTENAQFGGVGRGHTMKGHGRYAIDVNIPGIKNEADDPTASAKMDAVVRSYQERGYRVLWNGRIYEPNATGPGGSIAAANARRAAKGQVPIGLHRNHAHIEAPAGLVGKYKDRTEGEQASYAASADKALSTAKQMSDQLDDQLSRMKEVSVVEGLRALHMTEEAQTLEEINNIRARYGKLLEGSAAEAALALGISEQDVGILRDKEKAVEGLAAAEVKRRAAERGEETYARIGDQIAAAKSEIEQTAKIEALRANGLNEEADKQEAIYAIRARYPELLAGEASQAAAILGISEAQLEVRRKDVTELEKSSAALIAARAAANDNATTKRLSGDIQSDIAQERERQHIDGLRLRGLNDQADAEYQIYQYRARYHDLLVGEPDVAAKVLGISKEHVIEQRKAFEISEKILSQGIASDQNRQHISSLADFYENAFTSGGRSIVQSFKAQMKSAIAQLAAQWTIGLLTGQKQVGGSIGSIIGGQGPLSSILGALSGGKSGRVNTALSAGGSVAGWLGIGKSATGLLGGAAGAVSKAVPYAAAALAVAQIGSMLFKKAKTGSATLGFSSGALGIGATSGNNAGQIAAASGSLGNVISSLESIAEQLGGTVSGAGSVSIGMRKKKYVVDPTGQGRTKGAGVLTFTEEKDAIAAALKDALSDGVIAGISAASQRIIQSGADIQNSIQKAILIEAIPKALKARLDPVGAALDALNAKWDKTISALKEGAASADQLADAEKLYKLERADAFAAANDNLKSFINSLNFGSNSTYSLIDQERSARAVVEPYLTAIRSGNYAAVDQQKYLSGAGEYLNIRRELGGSGPEWFAAVDEFRTASQSLADGLAAGSSTASARDPFAEMTANSTRATADILAGQSTQLASIQATLAQIAASGGFSSGGGFIGSDRSFLANAA
jgi:hypothetical protein